MGQATNLALRERILELRQQGATIKSIGEQLSLPFSTTKNLCRRFREKGTAGLSPGYSNCGTKSSDRFADNKERALGLRLQHPNWGAPRIRVEMQLAVDGQPAGNDCPLPSIRTLQKWYRASGLYKPRRQGAGPAIGRSRAPHNIWEVDAKENLALADGSPACYLTIGDEKTGAWLEAVVFPLQEDEPGAPHGSAGSPVRDI
jgi:transposase